MDKSLIFLYTVFAISIFILILAAINYAFLIIPLVWRLARVRNGLITLRRLLLWKAILAEITIVIVLFALTIRFITPDVNILRYIITFAIFSLCLTLFGKSVFDRRIFKNNFSIKNMELHAKFEAEENSRIDKKIKK